MMVIGNLRKIFLDKNTDTVNQIITLAKRLEKENNSALVAQIKTCTESLLNDAFASHEHPIAFLAQRIGNLAQMGNYYLATQFAEGLGKKIEEMQKGSPDTGIEPPKPKEEVERLAAVRRLKLLDTEPEHRFDNITKIATELFKVPISTITLVEDEREWHKSTCGLNDREGSRNTSFCGHAILEDDMMLIPDASKDPRFADNEKVTGPQHIRFYAGMPLLSIDGHKVGTFCLKDIKPKELTKAEIEEFKALALWAELEINAADIGKTLLQLREAIKHQLGVA